MKYVVFILGFLALLFVGFLTVGFLKPEIEYDCEIVVNKPLAESWAVSQDDSKMAERLVGFQRIEPVQGTPGTVGAVSDVYFKNDGKEMIVREKIIEINEHQSISMLFKSDFMDMDYTLQMEPSGSSTIIRSSTLCQGNSWVSKSILALMGTTIKEQEETNLAKLKQTIEANTKEY